MEGFCCLSCINADKKRREEIDGVHMVRCKRKHAYVNISQFCPDYDYDYDVKIYEVINDVKGEKL